MNHQPNTNNYRVDAEYPSDVRTCNEEKDACKWHEEDYKAFVHTVLAVPQYADEDDQDGRL